MDESTFWCPYLLNSTYRLHYWLQSPHAGSTNAIFYQFSVNQWPFAPDIINQAVMHVLRQLTLPLRKIWWVKFQVHVLACKINALNITLRGRVAFVMSWSAHINSLTPWNHGYGIHCAFVIWAFLPNMHLLAAIINSMSRFNKKNHCHIHYITMILSIN